jgi:hypothetical protein
MRDTKMCVDGIVVSLAALNGLGRLVASTDDRSLLDDIERRLSEFETRLPDYRVSLRHFAVWSQNGNSIDQLAHDGQRFKGGLLGPTIMRVWSTYRILRHGGEVRDLKGLAAIASREESTRFLDERTRTRRRDTSEFLNMDQREVYVLGTFNVIDAYRATQLAIQLQRWRLTHAAYPRDMSLVAAPERVRGLTYTATTSGKGYKLTGYQKFFAPRCTRQRVMIWLYGMSMVKVTFTLDERTVSRLRQTAARANKPQSQVIREAVNDYADRVGKLSEAERIRMLAALDAIVNRKPARTAADVDEELGTIRAARRGGGRRHRA